MSSISPVTSATHARPLAKAAPLFVGHVPTAIWAVIGLAAAGLVSFVGALAYHGRYGAWPMPG